MSVYTGGHTTLMRTLRVQDWGCTDSHAKVRRPRVGELPENKLIAVLANPIEDDCRIEVLNGDAP